MSYHTHHFHHGKSLIKRLLRKRVCVYVCVKKHLSKTEIVMDLLSCILKSSALTKTVCPILVPLNPRANLFLSEITRFLSVPVMGWNLGQGHRHTKNK